jgi:cell division protein FtsL
MAAAPAAHAAPAAPPRVRPAAPAAPRHQRPRLELVAPPRHRWRLRTGPTFALGTVLAFAIAFLVVACQVVLVQGQQRLDRLDLEISSSSATYQRLRLEVAELESPERIVEAATTQLGMAPPPEVTYLTPNGAVTVVDDGDLIAPPDPVAEHAATRPNLDGGG